MTTRDIFISIAQSATDDELAELRRAVGEEELRRTVESAPPGPDPELFEVAAEAYQRAGLDLRFAFQDAIASFGEMERDEDSALLAFFADSPGERLASFRSACDSLDLPPELDELRKAVFVAAVRAIEACAKP